MKRFTALVLVGLGVTTIASSCVSIREQDWQQTRRENTVSAYKAYAAKYPENSYRANQAADKLLQEEKAREEEAQYTLKMKASIQKNWGKLRKGMSIEEVVQLDLLNRSTANFMISMSGGKEAANNPRIRVNLPLSNDLYFMRFDETGLQEWRLNQ